MNYGPIHKLIQHISQFTYFLQRTPLMMDSISKFNNWFKVSTHQRLFETTEHTLRFDGIDNFFTGLLSDRTPSLKDNTGAYFIDR